MVANLVGLGVVAVLLALLPFAGGTKAEASVEDGQLYVRPVGLSKFFALRSHVSVPANMVRSVALRDDVPRLGMRVAGTGLGRMCTAGYYRNGTAKSFACVGRSRPVVEITLDATKYDRILFSADDPHAVVDALRTRV